MSAEIINIWDYRRKEEKATLEQQAQELAKEFNRMAEEGTEVVCEMDTAVKAAQHVAVERLAGHRSVLDSLTPEQLREIAAMDEPAVLCGRYVAPPEDCA